MEPSQRNSPWKKRALILLGLLLVIQLVPVDRSNPAITADFDAPPEIDAILRRGCYDCHSNETRWPWYTRIAPVSWAVARDVAKGREGLNYSACGEIPDEARAQLRKLTWSYVAEGSMPPRSYVWLHGDAELTEDDLSRLRTWAGE